MPFLPHGMEVHVQVNADDFVCENLVSYIKCPPYSNMHTGEKNSALVIINNYRRIALISHTSKILVHIIQKRMKDSTRKN